MVASARRKMVSPQGHGALASIDKNTAMLIPCSRGILQPPSVFCLLDDRADPALARMGLAHYYFSHRILWIMTEVSAYDLSERGETCATESFAEENSPGKYL